MTRTRPIRCARTAAMLFVTLAFAFGQQDTTRGAPKESQRILGLIPNYQTVNDPKAQTPALTSKQKFHLFMQSTFDPFVLTDVALGATISHIGGGIPQYGSNREAYFQRLGAAYADVVSQSAFTTSVFPTLLHQDPRYFRLGPQHNLWKRIGYSMSRVAVTRNDNGKQAPNWSFFLGTAAGVASSNAWYPAVDRNAGVMGSRMVAISIGSATGNLLPEFWPDIQIRVIPRVLPYLLLHFRKAPKPIAPSAGGAN